METRRTFLTKAAAAGLAAAVPELSCSPRQGTTMPMKTNDPGNALVLYYSQTGHTRRMGRVIAGTWERMGIRTRFLDIREADKSALASYDLIVLGSPVFYWDVPENVMEWLRGVRGIEGTPVAAYVTYGGGGNSRNCTSTLLDLAAAGGGVPAGMIDFSNMSSFAPTWSILGPERTLRLGNLPNEESFMRARGFAEGVVAAVRAGRAYSYEREFTITDQIRGTGLLWLYKAAVGHHRIDPDRCTGCGTCAGVCPTGAIDPVAGRVNTERCILCLGCVNNCPAQAVDMEFLGHRVYGFHEMLRRNNVVIREPAENMES